MSKDTGNQLKKERSKFHPTHGVPDETECLTCGGHGFKHIRKDNRELEEIKCVDCDGTGNRPPGQKKPSAKARTLDIMDAIDTAKKRGSSEEIVEKLTDSVRIAKLDKQSGELPVESEDTEMATKKKTSKKQRVNSRNGSKEVKTAAPIGRERKLLLRLSKEEYNTLQAKAEKQGTSMANLLRTSAIG